MTRCFWHDVCSAALRLCIVHKQNNVSMNAKQIYQKGMPIMLLAATMPIASATVLFSDGFETPWSTDYAPGWVNAGYRHGEAPVGQMMQQTTFAHSGSYGMKLIAQSVPQSWMWWAAVEVESLPAYAMRKEYDPWVSVWYYDDDVNAQRAGQLYAVPDWVNLYLENNTEDWTDIQFGARFNIRDN